MVYWVDMKELPDIFWDWSPLSRKGKRVRIVLYGEETMTGYVGRAHFHDGKRAGLLLYVPDEQVDIGEGVGDGV